MTCELFHYACLHAQLKEIEDECKAHVGKALSVYSKEVPLEQARPIRGLRAVFGEVKPHSPLHCRLLYVSLSPGALQEHHWVLHEHCCGEEPCRSISCEPATLSFVSLVEIKRK